MENARRQLTTFIYSLAASVVALLSYGFWAGTGHAEVKMEVLQLQKQQQELMLERREIREKLSELDRKLTILVTEQRFYHNQE